MAEENQQETNPLNQHPPESLPALPRSYGDLLMKSNSEAKREWPEVIGWRVDEAEKKIKEEKEGVRIQVVQSGSFVTMDYREDRVRIYVDAYGKVDKAPRVG